MFNLRNIVSVALFNLVRCDAKYKNSTRGKQSNSMLFTDIIAVVLFSKSSKKDTTIVIITLVANNIEKNKLFLLETLLKERPRTRYSNM